MRRYPDGRLMLYNYIMGFVIGFGCFLGTGSVVADLKTGSITANKLPPAFEDYIVLNIDARIKQESEPMKSFLQENRLEIDTYFAAA